MKVYARSGSYFIIDPQDGSPTAFVVKLLEDNSLEVFPRVSTKEALLKGYWEAPEEGDEETALVEKLLKDVVAEAPPEVLPL